MRRRVGSASAAKVRFNKRGEHLTIRLTIAATGRAWQAIFFCNLKFSSKTPKKLICENQFAHVGLCGCQWDSKRHMMKERNIMNFWQSVFVKQIGAPALMAAVVALLAGCSSTSNSGSPSASVPPPPTQYVPPPPALSADQMAKLCQEAPETCHRVQALQPLTLADVKVMAKLSFGPDVIITQVRNSHTVYHLTANNIIDLKNSGVSEQVIDFLISTPNSIAGSTPVPEPQTNPSAQTPPPPPPD